MLFIVGDTYPFMAYIDLLLSHAFVSPVDSLSQSNCIPLSHPPAPVYWGSGIERGVRYRRRGQNRKGVRVSFSRVLLRVYLASYFAPGHVAIDMGVFPSAGVREYACSGLYLVVDPGAGTAQSHIHRSLHYVDHEVAKSN